MTLDLARWFWWTALCIMVCYAHADQVSSLIIPKYKTVYEKSKLGSKCWNQNLLFCCVRCIDFCMLHLHGQGWTATLKCWAFTAEEILMLSICVHNYADWLGNCEELQTFDKLDELLSYIEEFKKLCSLPCWGEYCIRVKFEENRSISTGLIEQIWWRWRWSNNQPAKFLKME